MLPFRAAAAACAAAALLAGCAPASPDADSSASPSASPSAGRPVTVTGDAPAATRAAYAAVAARALPRVRAVLGSAAPRRLALTAYRSESETESRLGAAPGAYRNLAAVTVGENGTRPGIPAGRIVVNPEAFSGLSETGKLVVLTHEAVHVALRKDTGPQTPTWLSEGIADYIAYRGSGLSEAEITTELRGRLRTAPADWPAALPPDRDFTGKAAEDGTGLAATYELSWTAARLIARQHGAAALVRLYRRIGGGTPLDRAMHGTLGTTTAAFTAGWRTAVRNLGVASEKPRYSPNRLNPPPQRVR